MSYQSPMILKHAVPTAVLQWI